MPLYKYEGQTYNLEDGLSNEEAIQRIQSHLQTAPAEEEVAQVAQEAVAQETVPDPVADPADEGIAQEFLEGVASGIIGIGQGVGELVGTGIDLVADTDVASYVTDNANELRTNLGIDPVGVVGKGAEIITQFVIPGAMAVGAVSKANMLSKALRLSPTKLGVASEAARTGGTALTSGQKFALLSQQAAAAGAADMVVATDGMTTIGDFFEGGPTQTSDETGLEGREEALRRLGNKFSVGLEGGLFTAGIPPVLGIIGKGGSAALTAKVIPVGKDAAGVSVREGIAPVIAGAVKKQAAKVGEKLEGLEATRAAGEEMGTFKKALASTAASLRYRGFLPGEAAEVRALIEGGTAKEVREATITMAKIEEGLEKALSKYPKQTAEASDLAKQSYWNKMEDFLTAPNEKARLAALKSLPKEVQKDVGSIRTQIDKLSKDIIKSDYMNNLKGKVNKKGQDLAELATTEINRNMGKYLRRRYEAFEVDNYKVSAENLAIGTAGFKKSAADTSYELRKMIEDDASRIGPAKKGYTNDTLGLDADGKIIGNVTAKQAKLAATNFVERKALKVRTKAKGLGLGASRVAENKVDTQMFLKRANVKDFQRALLGEIKDPREQVLGTVADLAQFKATDKYFGKLRELASTNPGVAKLFVNTADLEPQQIKALNDSGYVTLPGKTDKKGKAVFGQSQWGSLEGYAVSKPVYDNLTRLVIADEGVVPSFIRATYGNFLKLKGVSQYSKTVLSPVTQVRNVTTASLFAAMQGNVGRGANLLESVNLVFNDIRKLPKDLQATELGKLQELGVIGSQAELKEIQNLISKGLGLEAKEGGRQFGSKFTDNAIGAVLGKGGKLAENMYQGGDNIWKIYNYTFELNKIKNALRNVPEEDKIRFLTKNRSATGKTVDELMEAEAASIVRDTVPNYNLSPDIIKQLRKLPTGNFIAFPAEIIRTGTNSITRALDEMADPNVAIQKIGLRRMTGVLTTTTVAPAALAAMAYDISGVSEEEMKAYQRSLAPEWEKNARLIPTGRDENGMPKYINYSYSNPYDLLERIAIGSLNNFEATKNAGGNSATAVGSAVNGALSEFVKPFTEESIMLEALRDVVDPNTEIVGLRQAGQLIGGRSGIRRSGAKVYNPQESTGEKAAKSFAHLANALLPSALPMKFKGELTATGFVEPSNTIRGLVNALDMGEETGISIKDRRNIERDFTEELSRAFTGVTENTADVPLGLTYKGFEFSKARTQSSNIVNSVARRANVTSDDIVNAFKSANEARFRAYNNFNNIIKDMDTLGLSPSVIRRKLKQAGVTGFNEVVRGKYDPIPMLSDSIQRQMRANGTIGEYRKARREIRSYLRDQRKREYTDVVDEEPQVEETPTLDLEPLSQAQPVQQPQQIAAASAPPVAAQAEVDSPLSTSAPVSIASNQQLQQQLVGGGNPINAAKNAQISRTV